MAIIKQYHKDTDTTYVYESVSYWDAEKGQSRSKRKCIGKIDPATGSVIPTGKRGRKKKDDVSAPVDKELAKIQALYEQAHEEASSLKVQVSKQEKQLAELTRQNQKLRTTLHKIQSLISDI